MNSVDVFREPQHGFHHVEVPAPRSNSWPQAPTALSARPLKVGVVGAGREMGLDEFLALTTSTALVVVVDGVLMHEQYLEGTTAEDRLLGNSATKSALAQLTGIAVKRKALPDIDAPVCDYVPELLGSGYDRVSVRQVLTMTSGVGWVEDYHDPNGPAARMLARWHNGEGGLRELVASIPAGHRPGTRFAYCSPDSMVLDWVRERATGQTFAEAVGDLWSVMGAERPAIVGLDSPLEEGGVAMAAGALAVTARDWARLGVLQIDGCWDGEQILDPTWVEESSRPQQRFLAPGRLPSTITTHAGFGYHWWPLDSDGTRVMADGMRGQFVYVDRPRRTVVVKTSAWPYDDAWWDRQCRDLCYLALPAIAQAASAR
jgi:CubicO group peptidase (beta-lactamase class C family)